MDANRFDLIILGGGCAGLSLARELSKILSWDQRTLIIESRTSYTNDHSWCFWTPKDPVLQQALSSLDNHQTIELVLGKKAVIIKNSGPGFTIELDDGQCVYASKVIDTRPVIYQEAKQAQVWQVFYGYEIETQEDFFDDTTVGLMENLTPRPQATEFIYTLPFTKRRALIEVTQFSSNLFNPRELIDPLNRYLEKNIGVNKFKILRSEFACLPMGLKSELRSTSPHYHYAGISAGAIRPATGYAFIRIQQWAKICAYKLSQREKYIPVFGSAPLVKAMDKIFLRALHDKPSIGVELFQALSERVSGISLARFLSDEARAQDYFSVIMALPKFKFLLYSLGINHLPTPER